MDLDSQVEEARRRLGLPEPRRPTRVHDPNRAQRGTVKALTPRAAREGKAKREKLTALRSQVINETDGLRYALAKFDPDLPEILERYIRAISSGDLSALDQERAVAFATKALIRKQAGEDILQRGVAIEEEQFDREGRSAGTKVKAHPLLEPLGKLDEQLGYTADQERLTRRSHGQGAKDDAIVAAITRDARLRAADKAGLPAPEPGMFKDAIDTEVLPSDADN